MEYKIEKNVSLDQFKTKASKYAIVDAMEMGDSVVFESERSINSARLRGNNRFPNRRYIRRKGENGELRLFRIE